LEYFNIVKPTLHPPLTKGGLTLKPLPLFEERGRNFLFLNPLLQSRTPFDKRGFYIIYYYRDGINAVFTEK